MTQGLEALLTPADDGFHAGSEPLFTEGSWWSFCEPRTQLGGWIYHLTRRNLGTALGGVWVWDATAAASQEVPYFLYHTSQVLPPGPHDLNDFAWPDGIHLQTLAPLSAYRLSYRDRDAIALDFEYRGVAPPYVSAAGDPPAPFRLEQLCRVTGTLELRGKSVPIDCLAMRDHSWGVRVERTLSPEPLGSVDPTALPRRPVVYFFGHASPTEGFFVMGAGGYLMRDGVRNDLAAIEQSVERSPASGTIATMRLEATDSAGRRLLVTGHPLSRIDRPSNSGFGMVYLMEWDLGNGLTGWGEIQDIWPLDLWSLYRRLSREGRA